MPRLQQVLNGYKKGGRALNKQWWQSRAAPEHVRNLVKERVQAVGGVGHEIEEVLVMSASLEPVLMNERIEGLLQRLVEDRSYRPGTNLCYICQRYHAAAPYVTRTLLETYAKALSEAVGSAHPPHLPSILFAFATLQVRSGVLTREVCSAAVRHADAITIRQLTVLVKGFLLLDMKNEVIECTKAVQTRLYKQPWLTAELSFPGVVTLLRGMVTVGVTDRFLLERYTQRIVSMRSQVLTQKESDGIPDVDAAMPSDVSLCLWALAKLRHTDPAATERLCFLISSHGVPRVLMQPLDIALMLKGLADLPAIRDTMLRRSVLTMLTGAYRAELKRVPLRATFMNTAAVLEAFCTLRHDTKPVHLLVTGLVTQFKGGEVPLAKHLASILTSLRTLGVQAVPQIRGCIANAVDNILLRDGVTTHDLHRIVQAGAHFKMWKLVESAVEVAVGRRHLKISQGDVAEYVEVYTKFGKKPPIRLINMLFANERGVPIKAAAAALRSFASLADHRTATKYITMYRTSITNASVGSDDLTSILTSCHTLSLSRSKLVLELSNKLKRYIAAYKGGGDVDLRNLVMSWSLVGGPCTETTRHLSAILKKALCDMTAVELADCYQHVPIEAIDDFNNRVAEVLEGNNVDPVLRMNLGVEVMVHTRFTMCNRLASAICGVVETTKGVVIGDFARFSRCYINTAHLARTSQPTAHLLDLLELRAPQLITSGQHNIQELFLRRRQSTAKPQNTHRPSPRPEKSIKREPHPDFSDEAVSLHRLLEHLVM
eukprot:TRINITY_DN34265_c0_g1_i1.p1 TRINITY_DN34265_c0_g1~~TRINITY_DN34265_c0_g1_i1.p1  ORF type:complete len:772 (+),score=127.09 TRINITY_DN34265_c0_g1_i1:36-2351(+)